MPGLPVGDAGRTFGHMDEMPQRIDPRTDRATAALLLGCTPAEVGYCPRCQGLTRRYGSKAQVLCPACRAADAPLDKGLSSGAARSSAGDSAGTATTARRRGSGSPAA